jgi:hypothetical protein
MILIVETDNGALPETHIRGYRDMNITVACNNVASLIEALTKFGGELTLEKQVTVITTDNSVALSVARPHKAKPVKKGKKPTLVAEAA